MACASSLPVRDQPERARCDLEGLTTQRMRRRRCSPGQAPGGCGGRAGGVGANGVAVILGLEVAGPAGAGWAAAQAE